MILLGKLLIGLYYLLITLNLYIFFRFCIPTLLKQHSNSFNSVRRTYYNVVQILISAILISIAAFIYNHWLAWHCDAGSLELAKIITQKERGGNIDEQFSKELRDILNFSQKQISDLTNEQAETCRKCEHKPLKPLRAHHCRSCMKDVLVMDHHCRKCKHMTYSAWINNCVGLRNHGYFVLFCNYLALACTLLIYPMWITSIPEYLRNPPVRMSHFILYQTKDILGFANRNLTFNEIALQTCLYQDIAVSLLMIGFSIWNWYLVYKGVTTIEQMYYKDPNAKPSLRLRKEPSPLPFRPLTSLRENLYLVFGTKNILVALFPFMRRKVPVNGLEWTFLYGKIHIEEKEVLMRPIDEEV